MLSVEVSYLGMEELHEDSICVFLFLVDSPNRVGACKGDCGLHVYVVVTYFINLNSSIIHMHVKSLTV